MTESRQKKSRQSSRQSISDAFPGSTRRLDELYRQAELIESKMSTGDFPEEDVLLREMVLEEIYDLQRFFALAGLLIRSEWTIGQRITLGLFTLAIAIAAYLIT